MTARVSLRSNVPIDHLEIVNNGEVVREIPLGGDRKSAAVTLTLPVRASGWYLLRARSDRGDVSGARSLSLCHHGSDLRARRRQTDSIGGRRRVLRCGGSTGSWRACARTRTSIREAERNTCWAS